MDDHFWGEIWDLLSRMGCDHPYVSFVFSSGYLGCFILGGVLGFVNICCWWCFLCMYVWLSVDRVRLCFGLLCLFVHICVLFRFLFIFVLGCGWPSDSCRISPSFQVVPTGEGASPSRQPVTIATGACRDRDSRCAAPCFTCFCSCFFAYLLLFLGTSMGAS